MHHGRAICAAVSGFLFLCACSRRPSDDVIAAQIQARYFSDPSVKSAAISVSVKDGKVTLAGTVASDGVHLRAFQLAYATTGVSGIYDQLAVAAPVPLQEASKPSALAPPVQAIAAVAPAPDPEPVERVDPQPATPVEAVTPAQQAVRSLGVRIRNAPVQAHVTHVLPPGEPGESGVSDVAAVAVPVPVPVPAAGVTPAVRRPGAGGLTLSAGGTPIPVFARWFEEIGRQLNYLRVSYSPGSDMAGYRGLADRKNDFAATSSPYTDAEISRMGGAWHFPVLIDGVVPICNVNGTVVAVNLTPQALAAIYMGGNVLWNDPVLVSANPKVNLPAAPIRPVHRSDASSTTDAWTGYLAQTVPEWRARYGTGKTIDWATGIEAAQNVGVAGAVRNTPNSIGYVDASYAQEQRLEASAVLNANGVFQKATPETLAAAAVSPFGSGSRDGRVSILNSLARQAYPIARYAWFVLPANPPEWRQKEGVRALMEWVLTDGQRSMPPSYGGLPPKVAANELSQLRQVY